MFARIAEPVRPDGQDRHDPLVVLIRIKWAHVQIWNVVASHNGENWYVSGLDRPCPWSEILERLHVLEWDPPFTVEVVPLQVGYHG